MGETGFPLQFGDGFAGLEGLDAWKNRGLVATWIVTQQDTRNGGETQRQSAAASTDRSCQKNLDGVNVNSMQRCLEAACLSTLSNSLFANKALSCVLARFSDSRSLGHAVSQLVDVASLIAICRRTSSMGIPLPWSTSASRNFAMICSAVCRCLPRCPPSGPSNISVYKILDRVSGGTSVAAIQESIDDLADNRSPAAVPVGEAIVVHTLELIEVVFDQSVKGRGFGVAWKIDAVGLIRHILLSGKTGDFAISFQPFCCLSKRRICAICAREV